eukprot:TRINITY_DN10465_c0_g1_i1.p1 TRINITY_DN10465_c0_g1~~TRINITY_DN10465_c0_g1_i1.p1  ORF type:complete len:675 (-),score=151.69 TRINITY_DN10465_c0_g1_i1:84-1967(-)
MGADGADVAAGATLPESAAERSSEPGTLPEPGTPLDAAEEAELEDYLEDCCKWTIFEDTEDEIRYLRRRSDVLSRAFQAARVEISRLQEAGLSIQEAFEELQQEFRQAVGDAAYWQALAEARAEELEALTVSPKAEVSEVAVAVAGAEPAAGPPPETAEQSPQEQPQESRQSPEPSQQSDVSPREPEPKELRGTMRERLLVAVTEAAEAEVLAQVTAGGLPREANTAEEVSTVAIVPADVAPTVASSANEAAVPVPTTAAAESPGVCGPEAPAVEAREEVVETQQERIERERRELREALRAAAQEAARAEAERMGRAAALAALAGPPCGTPTSRRGSDASSGHGARDWEAVNRELLGAACSLGTNVPGTPRSPSPRLSPHVLKANTPHQFEPPLPPPGSSPVASAAGTPPHYSRASSPLRPSSVVGSMTGSGYAESVGPSASASGFTGLMARRVLFTAKYGPGSAPRRCTGLGKPSRRGAGPAGGGASSGSRAAGGAFAAPAGSREAGAAPSSGVSRSSNNSREVSAAAVKSRSPRLSALVDLWEEKQRLAASPPKVASSGRQPDVHYTVGGTPPRRSSPAPFSPPRGSAAAMTRRPAPWEECGVDDRGGRLGEGLDVRMRYATACR